MGKKIMKKSKFKHIRTVNPIHVNEENKTTKNTSEGISD